MLKMLRGFILMILLTINGFSLEDTKCVKLYNKYGININIKRPKGWIRVYNNNKLDLYTVYPLTDKDKLFLLDCFNREKSTTQCRSYEILRVGD